MVRRRIGGELRSAPRRVDLASRGPRRGCDPGDRHGRGRSGGARDPSARRAPPEPPPPDPVVPPPPPPPRARPTSPEPPPAPEDVPPVSFDNLTLTNTEGQSGFSVPASSGDETETPQRNVRPGPPPTPQRGSPGGVPGGQGQAPAIVPVENLSRRPEPPSSLGELLTRFYPPQARRQGIEGTARVRLRIAPDGSTQVLRTMSASRPEFATACSTMLRTTRWRPPLDQAGQPVATVVQFDCRFEVQW